MIWIIIFGICMIVFSVIMGMGWFTFIGKPKSQTVKDKEFKFIELSFRPGPSCNEATANTIMDEGSVMENKLYFLEPWESADGWRFRIRHKNGNIIAGSEAYASKQMMENTLNNLSKESGLEIESSLKIHDEIHNVETK